MASSDESDDALKRLSDRLEQASEAAERLIAQATDEATARLRGRSKPPPRGWQVPEEPAAEAPLSADLALLLQAARELIPPDLQPRLTEAIRELLLALRALIDWYVERLDQRRSDPVEVRDIPVL